MDSPALMR